MTRRLLKLLTLLSLLLCVATVALWVRSYWFADVLSWSGGRVYSVGSHNGLLVWNDFRPDPGKPTLPWWQTYSGRDPGYDWDRLGPSAWNRLGFGFAVGFTAGNNRIRQVTVPDWFPTLFLALSSAMALRSVAGRRRLARAGLCPRCGYDLRATPGKCPECGKAVPADGNAERDKTRFDPATHAKGRRTEVPVGTSFGEPQSTDDAARMRSCFA